MGIISWFQKKVQEEVTGTRVLVASLGPEFEELVTGDSEIWRRYYPSVTATTFSTVPELLDRVSRRYDVVHLCCDVASSGAIGDNLGGTVTGADFIDKCCEADVKLLWIASGNKPEGYRVFGVKGKNINLVMTIDRHGLKFSYSLDKLLSRMSNGERMPPAWVNLWPQVPGSAHQDAPDGIFFSGRPGVVLLS